MVSLKLLPWLIKSRNSSLSLSSFSVTPTICCGGNDDQEYVYSPSACRMRSNSQDNENTYVKKRKTEKKRDENIE